jgi:hypothetical protein
MTRVFEPPLQFAGTSTVFIRSLDDAAVFLWEYNGRWPATEDLILRRLDAASRPATPQRPFAGGRTWRDCYVGRNNSEFLDSARSGIARYSYKRTRVGLHSPDRESSEKGWPRAVASCNHVRVHRPGGKIGDFRLRSVIRRARKIKIATEEPMLQWVLIRRGARIASGDIARRPTPVNR